MFDRFTDDARKAMSLARKEAIGLRHGFIGPGHILLGVIGVGDCIAARILKDLGADPGRIRLEIEKRLAPGSDPVVYQLPFTPDAKKVLEEGMAAADSVGHRHIGTEHLLMGLLVVRDEATAPVLGELGVGLEAVQKRTVAYPQGGCRWRPPRIRNGLELVDDDGHVRARLDLRPDGSPFLEMLDAAGRPRLLAGLDVSGVPSIELLDEAGESRTWRP